MGDDDGTSARDGEAVGEMVPSHWPTASHPSSPPLAMGENWPQYALDGPSLHL